MINTRTRLRRIKDIPLILFFAGTCLTVGHGAHAGGSHGADLRLIVETDSQILERGKALPLTSRVINDGESTIWFEMGEPYIELTNAGGERISAPMPEPNTPPPGHYFMERNGKRVYTVPVYKVEGQGNVLETIPDALKYYHGFVSEGMYELRARITLAFFQESEVFRREDYPGEFWVEPQGGLPQIRLVSNSIKIELRASEVEKRERNLFGWPYPLVVTLIVMAVVGIVVVVKIRAVKAESRGN